MSSPYVGEIRMFAGVFAPAGWAFCDGRLLSVDEYDALFALIGVTYGGDGIVTFALPDLRGRIPIHIGNGPGLDPYVLGQQGGTETVTVTTNQIPTHSHAAVGSSAAAESADPANRTWAVSAQANPYHSTVGTASMAADALASAGGSQPHNNMPPFLAVNFIISLYGVFPSQT